MNPFRIPSDFVAKNFFVLRFVMSGWLIGFYIKLIFYGPYLWRIVPEYPMRYNHFPEFLMNASVAQIFYLLPLISLFIIGSQRQDRLLFCSAMMTLSSFILFLHIDTYNDMTFLTTFWSGLWMIWFASQANRTDQNFRLHACVLAQCLVGIIFLGGTVGKLTSGYWNGTVFYNIFFQSPNQPLVSL